MLAAAHDPACPCPCTSLVAQALRTHPVFPIALRAQVPVPHAASPVRTEPPPRAPHYRVTTTFPRCQPLPREGGSIPDELQRHTRRTRFPSSLQHTDWCCRLRPVCCVTIPLTLCGANRRWQMLAFIVAMSALGGAAKGAHEYTICITPSTYLPKGCCNTYGLKCTFSELDLHVRDMDEDQGVGGYHYANGGEQNEAEFTLVKMGDSYWTGQVYWKWTGSSSSKGDFSAFINATQLY